MRTLKWFVLGLVLWNSTFCAINGSDQALPPIAQPEAPALLSEPAETAQALIALRDMSDFLGAQRSFSFESDANFDVVQPTGTKLEFGSTRKIVIRRPDRVYLTARQREGKEQTLYFDGSVLSIAVPDRESYASEALPGTVVTTLDYLVEEIGVPAPLADLIHPDLYGELAPQVLSASWVGEDMLDGVACDHLVFRTAEVDFQLWIEQGERPLPTRVVITYRNYESAPQFRASFHDWSLGAEVPNDRFTFTPPEGWLRLPIRELFEPSQSRSGEP